MITLMTNLKVGPVTAKATTQRVGFPFTSMCKFGGSYLGVSSSGLFSLGGDDLDGSVIDSYFEPITTDFGIANDKRMRFVYLGFECSGKLTLVITVDEKTERSYNITPKKTGQQRIRVAIGRDGAGRYWNFRIKNVNGCDFSIDSIDILPIILPQRFDGY